MLVWYFLFVPITAVPAGIYTLAKPMEIVPTFGSVLTSSPGPTCRFFVSAAHPWSDRSPSYRVTVIDGIGMAWALGFSVLMANSPSRTFELVR